MLSQHLMNYLVGFFFEYVYVVDYIDRFPYIKPSLHPLDEVYSVILMDDHFDVFLDSAGKNFIEHFCIDIHNGNWSKFLFVGSWYGLGIRVIVAS